ncbi:MAG: PmoA family protein [Gemmataceae bacterium]
MRTLLTLATILALSAQADAQSGVSIQKKDGEYAVTIAGQPFTTLVAQKDDLAKPYLYPVLAPAGVPVTRDWPMKKGTQNQTTDHVHQKSAWFCHGDVIPVGVVLKQKSSDKHVKGVDFWSESPGHGRIVVTDISVPKSSDPDAAFINTIMEWRAPEGIVVLTEKRVYKFSRVAGGRLISVASILTANNGPVEFGDTKEGSFGIRVHDSLRMTLKGGDGMLTNSAGKKGMKDVWGLPADWCDYSGTVNGKAAGVAIFAHPGNPIPSLWHARDYGLLAANPFGRKASGFPAAKDRTDLFKIEKDKNATFRFAIFAHDGDVKSGQVAEAYEAYARPGL